MWVTYNNMQSVQNSYFFFCHGTRLAFFMASLKVFDQHRIATPLEWNHYGKNMNMYLQEQLA